MPALITSLFQVKQHHYDRQSLTIHYPQEELSIAENILYLLREDHSYTPAEAAALDVRAISEYHGGGNNSTFTNVVVASTGSDFFSTISASIGSLKGPRHGGANLRVVEMMAAMQEEIGLDPSDEQLRDILMRLLNRDFYDHAGLIYGIGHAIYTLSDPRAEIIRSYCERLAKEKGREQEVHLLPPLRTDGHHHHERSQRHRCLCQCRPVQRLCLYDAQYPPGALYSPVCVQPYIRMAGS